MFVLCVCVHITLSLILFNKSYSFIFFTQMDKSTDPNRMSTPPEPSDDDMSDIEDPYVDVNDNALYTAPVNNNANNNNQTMNQPRSRWDPDVNKRKGEWPESDDEADDRDNFNRTADAADLFPTEFIQAAQRNPAQAPPKRTRIGVDTSEANESSLPGIRAGDARTEITLANKQTVDILCLLCIISKHTTITGTFTPIVVNNEIEETKDVSLQLNKNFVFRQSNVGSNQPTHILYRVDQAHPHYTPIAELKVTITSHNAILVPNPDYMQNLYDTLKQPIYCGSTPSTRSNVADAMYLNRAYKDHNEFNSAMQKRYIAACNQRMKTCFNFEQEQWEDIEDGKSQYKSYSIFSHTSKCMYKVKRLSFEHGLQLLHPQFAYEHHSSIKMDRIVFPLTRELDQQIAAVCMIVSDHEAVQFANSAHIKMTVVPISGELEAPSNVRSVFQTSWVTVNRSIVIMNKRCYTRPRAIMTPNEEVKSPWTIHDGIEGCNIEVCIVGDDDAKTKDVMVGTFTYKQIQLIGQRTNYKLIFIPNKNKEESSDYPPIHELFTREVYCGYESKTFITVEDAFSPHMYKLSALRIADRRIRNRAVHALFGFKVPSVFVGKLGKRIYFLLQQQSWDIMKMQRCWSTDYGDTIDYTPDLHPYDSMADYYIWFSALRLIEFDPEHPNTSTSLDLIDDSTDYKKEFQVAHSGPGQLTPNTAYNRYISQPPLIEPTLNQATLADINRLLPAYKTSKYIKPDKPDEPEDKADENTDEDTDVDETGASGYLKPIFARMTKLRILLREIRENGLHMLGPRARPPTQGLESIDVCLLYLDNIHV